MKIDRARAGLVLVVIGNVISVVLALSGRG